MIVKQTRNFVKDLFVVCYGAKRMFYMHHILDLIIKIHDHQGIYHFTNIFIYFLIYIVLFAKEINSPRC